ncbi:MAG TPA: hypothetical protein VFI76_06455 [Terrimicrobiaceae bacterium]|nr:hypothetical protein [Terrimicrobiaceae bacterium]
MEVRPPLLQASGAGIPSWQRLAGKYVYLPLWCRYSSWERTPYVLEAQAGRLLQGAASLGDELMRRRVLIPPLVGLEDSSRYDSYAMVLEHLTIVGHVVARIAGDLGHGRRPTLVLRVAEVKAQDQAAPSGVVAGYREMLAAFRHAALDSGADRRSPLRHEHPWFGALDAYQWLCFATLHQVVHLKQVRAILRRVRPRG